MCFGTQPERKKKKRQPEHIELASPVPRGIRQVETLQALEYVVYPVGIADTSDFQEDDEDIVFYRICHRNADPRGPSVAVLGAGEQPGLLVVPEIYTIRDPRSRRTRPRAAAILLSFWLYHLGRPIESLRTIRFKTVMEDSMSLWRPEIYRLMGYELWERLTIRRGGNEQGEGAVFDLICTQIKLGRCVKLMETWNQAMKDAGIMISQLKFRPRNESEVYFNFVVEFRVYSSHHSGGH